MVDRNKGGSNSAKLGTLVRKATAQVRERGEVSLRGVRRSVVEAGDRLKSSHASKQMGSAVESWRVIKKAADAQRRGNHAMAYRLLEPKVQANPADAKLVVAFWSAALACDRPEDAASFMTGIIRRIASSGKPDRAAELWMELRSAVPSARVDPSALVHIAETLEVGGGRDPLVQALRDAADSDSRGLSPGLAVRIAEMAREIDPPTALRAVRRALEAPGLHEAKRMRLGQLEEELVAAAAGSTASEPAPASSRELQPATQSVCNEGRGAEEPTPDLALKGPEAALERSALRELADEPRSGAEWMEAAADEALRAADPIARFRDLKLREAMPTGLLAEGVALQLPAGRTARIEYTKIDAIAVAEVMGLAQHPVVVVDLLLNWSSEQDPTLRAVRLRSDGFDPRMVFEAPDDRAEAFRSFLSELRVRCNAVPLPDLASAEAVGLRTFETLEAYAREVLQVES
jgi:hypothetical protein